MAKKKHALLAPSSAMRWLSCTPSAMLESKCSEEASSTAADEGTAAHALCEHKLKKALKLRSRRPTSSYDTDEMEEASDGYRDYVMEIMAGLAAPQVFIEQHIDFSSYVPDGFGTADCIIIAGNQLHIVDFKYGLGVLVDAHDNPQLKCYALGAMELFGSLYDIEHITLHIYQPRRENVSTFELTAGELLEWAEKELKPRAALAMKGEGEFHCGPWCQFCRASNRCRARAEEKLKLAQSEFAQERLPPLLTDEEIAAILPILPDLARWADAIQAYASDAAINHGKTWPGFKLVRSRTVRKYKDEEKVAEAAEAAGYSDIYRRKLIPITELEKLMGKSKFQDVIGGLIVKPIGRPTLVPESDKRPAIDVSTDFTEVK